MTNEKLALLRLAAREFESVSASCEMFISHVDDWGETDKRLRQIFNQFCTIQQKADKLMERLNRDLEAYESIEVKEIY